jgi:hypothetical protein
MIPEDEFDVVLRHVRAVRHAYWLGIATGLLGWIALWHLAGWLVRAGMISTRLMRMW